MEVILDSYPDLLDMAVDIISSKLDQEHEELETGAQFVLPQEVNKTLDAMKKKLQMYMKEFSDLGDQDEAVQVLQRAKRLEPDTANAPRKSNKNAETLARYEGESWSEDVFDLVQKETIRAKNILIRRAQEGSQWRSTIQVIMICLASLSVLCVWIKFNAVSKKLML